MHDDDDDYEMLLLDLYYIILILWEWQLYDMVISSTSSNVSGWNRDDVILYLFYTAFAIATGRFLMGNDVRGEERRIFVDNLSSLQYGHVHYLISFM